MRTLLAIVILAAGMFALSEPSDAARKAKRIAKPPDAAQPRYSRQQVECERARHEDPSGDFAGYPCWARAALGSGRNIDNR